jgi:hypothetical protein
LLLRLSERAEPALQFLGHPLPIDLATIRVRFFLEIREPSLVLLLEHREQMVDLCAARQQQCFRHRRCGRAQNRGPEPLEPVTVRVQARPRHGCSLEVGLGRAQQVGVLGELSAAMPLQERGDALVEQRTLLLGQLHVGPEVVRDQPVELGVHELHPAAAGEQYNQNGDLQSPFHLHGSRLSAHT